MDFTNEYILKKNSDGTMYYNGSLGEFNYNPNEFELKQVEVNNTMNEKEPYNVTVLSYIGNDSGENINIPKGIEDISYMFANNNNIKKIPKIPYTVKSMNFTFTNSTLEDGNTFIPMNVENMTGAFLNCKNLKKSVDIIDTKHVDYAFYGCDNLKEPPILGNRVRTTNFMFAECKNLERLPNLHSKIEDFSFMTYGCNKLDEFKDSKDDYKFTKVIDEINKKENKASILSMMTGGLSYLIQMHALNQTTKSMFKSYKYMNEKIKSGNFDKSLASTLGQVLMSKGGFTGLVGVGLMSMHNNKINKKTIKTEELNRDLRKLEQYNIKDKIGLDGIREAKKDLKKNNLFDIGLRSGIPARFYKEYYNSQDSATIEFFNNEISKGSITSSDKKVMADFCIKKLLKDTAYYKETKSILNDRVSTKFENDVCNKGLDKVIDYKTDNVVGFIKDNLEFFNDGDIRKLKEISKSVPNIGEKLDDTLKIRDDKAKNINIEIKEKDIDKEELKKKIIPTIDVNTSLDYGMEL